MGIQSKDLLDQLADLQLALEGYSLEQLSVEEAQRLKSSFEIFRVQLEEQLWKPVHGSRIYTKRPEPARHWDADGLIAAVSHDIRVPLQAIMGFADLLEEEDLTKPQDMYVASIRSASKTLKGIAEELAAYSRLKTGENVHVEVPFSPVNLLQEAVVFARILVEQKPVSIDLTTGEGMPEQLQGDPSRLNRILMNLLENAAKYVEKGKVHVAARAVRSEKRYMLEVEIRDDGIGIPEAELPFIFKPYYQAKQDGATADRGHGLGLAIVKKLVDEQEGNISVESSEGNGSTFKLQLPFGKARQTKSTPGKAQKKQFGRELQGVRVLVFEDNPFNAELLMSRLQSWGCLVYHADRVPVGLRMLEEKPVDLILMDLRMPQMDGYQATYRIRTHANKKIRQTPVIALTADFTAADKNDLQERGMDGLLLKPYDPQELYNSLVNLNKEGTSRNTISASTSHTDLLKPGEDWISLDYLESECLGDATLMASLVQMFKGNLLEFAGRMKICIDQVDHGGIVEAAHKMLSSLRLVHAHFFLNLVEAIYQDAAEGREIAHIKGRYLKFLRHYPMLLKALDRELDKRKPNGDES